MSQSERLSTKTFTLPQSRKFLKIHYFHAEHLSVNNYVRESNFSVCGIKVHE